MKRRFIYFCIIFLLPTVVLAQSYCSKIKKGKFYFYPPNSEKEFLIVRNNSIQKEININIGDTSYWKIYWQSPCIFNLKFLRKSQPVSHEELQFYNSHKTVIEVLKVTKDYYVFKGSLDSINTGAVTDTLWFKRKQN